MSLDPQIAGLLEALDAGFPPVHTMSGAQARAAIPARFVCPDQPEPVGTVRDETIPGDIAVRIYRPAVDSRLPILVYAHGDGFVFCDLDSHDGLCRSLANLVPAVVVSVAYRLAPERRWPAAAEDVYAATHWAARNAVTLGGDASRIVVGGDSAGGNLAAVTALMARDLRGRHPRLHDDADSGLGSARTRGGLRRAGATTGRPSRWQGKGVTITDSAA